MGYFEKHGRDQDRNRWERWERWQPSRSDRFLQQNPQRREQTDEAGFDPRERPWGDEDFNQDREHWREPMEFERRTGRLQWGGESLDRGYYPRRQPREHEWESYPREAWHGAPQR